MANKIILKKTSTASKIPLATDLEIGEIAVNLADQKLYSKNASGTVILVGDGQGTGDVVGPSSATDNAIARFDTTTGKLIQNSVVTVNDTGSIAGILSEQYNIAGTPPTIVEGLEAWDSGNGTLELGLLGGNVSYKYGQQEFVRAYNGSGLTMTKGQVVYIVGAQGNRVDVRLAKGNAESTSAGTIGFVVETIANGAEGWVQASGTLYKLDTSALTAGAAIYLSTTVAGGYTTTKPTAPNHTVILGWVERVSATVGSIYVKVDNGYELDELHNVLINTPTTGQSLVYNASTGVWENSNAPILNNATGLPLSTGVTGTLPVANGGTGQTTTNAAFNALVPSQTGNTGKYLTTDGSNTSWATVSGGGTFVFPFYNSSGVSDTIALLSNTYLPFYNSSGVAKNILLIS